MHAGVSKSIGVAASGGGVHPCTDFIRTMLLKLFSELFAGATPLPPGSRWGYTPGPLRNQVLVFSYLGRELFFSYLLESVILIYIYNVSRCERGGAQCR